MQLDKACLLHFNGKISQHMQYRSVGVRASALGIANAKCKENLAFQTPKYSAFGIAKSKYCKFFCNIATVQ